MLRRRSGRDTLLVSKLAAERLDSFWVMGPHWAHGWVPFFPPDECRWDSPGAAVTASAYVHALPDQRPDKHAAARPITTQTRQKCTAVGGRQIGGPGGWLFLSQQSGVATAVPPELRYLCLLGVCSLSEVHLDD